MVRIPFRPGTLTAGSPALPAGAAEAEVAGLLVTAAGLTPGLCTLVVIAAVVGVTVPPDKVLVWMVKGWLDALPVLDEKGPVPQNCPKSSTKLGGQLD